MPKVTQVKQSFPIIQRKKKVAAYARVSRDSERLLHSLSAQVSYYSSLIQNNPEWEYAGVYADEAVTGTLVRKREQFQKMVEDAEAGRIDIILTKSIQRFARNTVDLLETVRHLKDIGVEVRFEEQNISTMSGDGELMLTILASFAQEEVRSLSENVRWAGKRKIDKGELPMVYVEDDHPAIIDPDFFDEVQQEMKRRKDGWLAKDFDYEEMRPFSRKVKCGVSGLTFHHSTCSADGYGNDGAWGCYKQECPYRGECGVKQVPDLAIRQAAKRALGMEVFDGGGLRRRWMKL